MNTLLDDTRIRAVANGHGVLTPSEYDSAMRELFNIPDNVDYIMVNRASDRHLMHVLLLHRAANPFHEQN